MQVHLDRQVGWKGQVYSGDCEIPDDLAIALNLVPQSEGLGSSLSDDEPTLPLDSPSVPAKTKPSKRRG